MNTEPIICTVSPHSAPASRPVSVAMTWVRLKLPHSATLASPAPRPTPFCRANSPGVGFPPQTSAGVVRATTTSATSAIP